MNVWRIQQTTSLETHPSWDGFRAVRPDCPADPDGWAGYWWATADGADLLIRAEDVEAAEAGAEVDTYVPGLYGCLYASQLEAYIQQIGGPDGLLVALYEGRVLETCPYEGAVVFEPRRLLRVWPAPEWVRLAEAGEFDEDE